MLSLSVTNQLGIGVGYMSSDPSSDLCVNVLMWQKFEAGVITSLAFLRCGLFFYATCHFWLKHCPGNSLTLNKEPATFLEFYPSSTKIDIPRGHVLEWLVLLQFSSRNLCLTPATYQATYTTAERRVRYSRMGKVICLHIFLLHLERDFVFWQVNDIDVEERVATTIPFCQNSHVTVSKKKKKK